MQFVTSLLCLIPADGSLVQEMGIPCLYHDSSLLAGLRTVRCLTSQSEWSDDAHPRSAAAAPPVVPVANLSPVSSRFTLCCLTCQIGFGPLHIWLLQLAGSKAISAEHRRDMAGRRGSSRWVLWIVQKKPRACCVFFPPLFSPAGFLWC